MSNLAAEVTLDWGDGTYLFRLSVAGLLELEEKTNSPFTVIYDRLNAGKFSSADLRETIRLGLIGGGMAPPKAKTLVERYVDGRPRLESWPHARAILGAVLFGFEVAPLGNPEAAPSDESPNASTPPASIGTRLSSEELASTPVGFRFGNGQPR